MLQRILRLLILSLVVIFYNEHCFAFEVDGIKYYIDSDNSYVASVVGKSITMSSLVIPETIQYGNRTCTVVEIAETAFSNCQDIKSVTIPKTIKFVGLDAFEGCVNLEKVIVPDIAAFCNIEFEKADDSHGNPIDYAHHIYKDVQTEYTELVIPETVKTIPWYTFYECYSFKSIILPNSVKSIGESAFEGCNNLTFVKSEIENPCNSINIFKGISSNAILEVPAGTKDQYLNNGWMTSFGKLKEQDSFFYLLSIRSTGKGVTYYNGENNGNKSYLVQENSKVTISFSPDKGYRLKRIKQNSEDVTNDVCDNVYIIDSISSRTSIEVEYEAIPTYTLRIVLSGNGSLDFNNVPLRNQSAEFMVYEGTSDTLCFYPDAGYRLASVKKNNVEVIHDVIDNQYIVRDVSEDVNMNVTFEEIPPTVYSMTITSTGNGIASYNGSVVRNQSKAFSVTEGSTTTVTFIPDNGYRIKIVKVDNVDVTNDVVNSQYTISNINKDVSLEVEFEEVPPAVCTLSISSKGFGSANYDGTSVRSKTCIFSVTAGTSALVNFVPDDDYRILSVKLDGADITPNVFNNQYTIVNITHDTTLEVEFAEDVTDITHNGVNYNVVSYIDATLNVASGNYGLSLSVPALVSFKNRQWKVVGVEANALNNCSELASIEWNPEARFNGRVSNPNLLLYVKDKQYGSEAIQNVVVNGEAEEIVLQETNGGNNFYCPKAFMAKKVTYSHNYSMKSGYKTCQGWETIALPFGVTKIQRQGGTELLPYQAWTQGSNQRPFWLYSLTELGWKAESSITANTPYIISMPNNEMYNPSYNISGIVQFIGENVQVKVSDNLAYGKDGNKKLIPNFQNQEASQDFFVLNVNNQWSSNTDAAVEGSVFIRGLRKIHPFEAYMTIGGNAASRVIPVFGDQELTGIYDIPFANKDNRDVKVYTLEGQLVATGKRAELMKKLSKGIFVIDGQKVVVIGK